MHDALKEAKFSPDRPVTRLLHDSPEMVLMHVLQGKGVFLTGKGEEPAFPGAFAVTEPNEPHGMKAAERTVMLAVIAPRP
jgi:quercetin dioxygenase-like cupin family protein